MLNLISVPFPREKESSRESEAGEDRYVLWLIICKSSDFRNSALLFEI